MPAFYQSYEWNKRLYKSIDDCKARIKPGDSHLIESHKKPNYFYYAVPEDMIQPEEVPPYAGLVWMAKEYRYCGGIIIKKKAPMLHKTKYTDGELNLAEKFWYNWQSDRRLRDEAWGNVEDLRQQMREELESKGQEMTYKQMEIRLKNILDYQQKYYEICRDQNINRMIIRKMRHELKQLNPNFDYEALEKQCEKCFGII